MIPLRGNLESVRERIARACARAGRNVADVQLIAVTKGVPAGVVAQLPELGVSTLGENRVQEAAEKKIALDRWPHLRWHLIGSLQTNKAHKAGRLFHAIHSLDRAELAKILARLPQAPPLFIEVNVAGEATKRGVAAEDAVPFVGRLRRDFPALRLEGLMTMAPLSNDPEASRPHFRRLARLAAECGLRGLSMGMSQDFEVAIEEGATHLRIGTAIFKGC